MLKLKHVTFTGVDSITKVEDLVRLHRAYPLVEFGVLYSHHWAENGPRFIPPLMLNLYKDKGLNLSLHLCGQAAHEASLGNYDKIDEALNGNLHLFNRIQLNISTRQNNPSIVTLPRYGYQEVIIQQKSVDAMQLAIDAFNCSSKNNVFSVLLDASGGTGKDTPIQVTNKLPKVGYAGGINPANVQDKLKELLFHPAVTNFWIDMESGVRTNDKFDIRKCWLVCQKVKETLMQAYSRCDYLEFIGSNN